ncbi:MAG: LUD domain-containing protein [Planctomycetota bacterium]|nr:LUD domain-containing protein [Planctomycetota bacterium]
MGSRSVMLGRIRRACAGTDASKLPSQMPDFPHYSDPVAQFRLELEAVGGVFLDGRGSGQLAEGLATVVRASDSTEVYWESEELFRRYGIPFKLRQTGQESANLLLFSRHPDRKVEFPLLLESNPYGKSEVAASSLSISPARLGIAETGTIVHEVVPGTGRLFSILPPARLTLLSERDLIMNSRELFADMLGEQCGSVLTLITGPSRTADIEKTLVVGVHGPKKLFVILTP